MKLPPHLARNQPRPTKLTFYGVPMGKPRMTRQDKWKQRDCVVRYRSFADELRAAVGLYAKMHEAPVRLDWVAYLPMPESWSKKKKAEHAGKVHRSKPDRDNIDKGILDALFEDDSSIACGDLRKYWDDGKGARIEIAMVWEATSMSDSDYFSIKDELGEWVVERSEVELAVKAQQIMRETGMYAAPIHGELWTVRLRNGRDMPLEYWSQRQDLGAFDCPNKAVVTAYEWLKKRAEKEEEECRRN